MKYWTNEISTKNGRISEQVPWSQEDYVQAIADLEAEITPRRIRESVLTPEGQTWLRSKELEIQQLREEMES